MKSFSRSLLLLVVFTLIQSGCVSKKKWNELTSQKGQMEELLTDTQQEVAKLKTDLSTLNSEKEQMMVDFDSEKETMNTKMSKFESDLGMMKKENQELAKVMKEKETKLTDLSEKIKSSFSNFTAKGGVSLDSAGDRLLVNSNNPIQFKSGSARIRKESRAALKSVADMMMLNTTSVLLIEGHTDNVPMKKNAPYASNLELSKARANAILKVLVKYGVDKNQLVTKGYGDSKPRVDYVEGDNSEVRNMNRRAEMALLSSPASMYDLSRTL